jgi:hypothetical protein
MVATFDAPSMTICPAAAEVLELLLDESELEEELRLELEMELELALETELDTALEDEDDALLEAELELALDVELEFEELLVEEVTLEPEPEFPIGTADFLPSEHAVIVHETVANSANKNALESKRANMGTTCSGQKNTVSLQHNFRRKGNQIVWSRRHYDRLFRCNLHIF